jgi:hypothetical protein
MADLTTKIKVTDGPGSGGGGAFWAEVVQGSISYDIVNFGVGDKFLTFCIENDEYVDFGSSYWVNIETQARGGGSGGPSPDPLDAKTAAMYEQWLALGDMTGPTATKYQLAIWKLEQEAVYDAGDTRWEDGNGAALAAAYQAYSEATIDALISGVGSPPGIGLVRVMTLWTSPTGTGSGYKQDLLVVPVPAAVLLGMLGLSVAGLKLRKYA